MEKLKNKGKRGSGSVIYQPSSRAAEYAPYAANFYVGCSNDCDYCYCKRGVLGHAMGKPFVTLKKCFKDEEDALKQFLKNLDRYLPELKQSGLFFTFTTDPMLEETRMLHWAAATHAVSKGVNVKFLTKRADFIDALHLGDLTDEARKRIAWGFTLTGCDYMEKKSSSNAERMAAMKRLHEMGFKTFASIEPVINPFASFNCITQTVEYCDLYKIGLLSGKRYYSRNEIDEFVEKVNDTIDIAGKKVYWKDSVKEYICRDIECSAGVGADYDLFADE